MSYIQFLVMFCNFTVSKKYIYTLHGIWFEDAICQVFFSVYMHLTGDSK